MSVDISIIIPTYRPTKFLHDCLLSVSKQTLCSEKYEIIIVLNGDNSKLYKDLIEREIAFFSSIRIIAIYTEVSGVSNARNLALDRAHGRYICFIDDDDFISDTYLEHMLLLVDCKSIVVSNVLTFKEENIQELLPDYITKAFLKFSPQKELHNKLMAKSFFSSSCCKLIPMEIIGDRRFDVNFKIGEDSLFMALISDKVIKTVFADNMVIYYRRVRTTSAYHRRTSYWERLKSSLLISLSFASIYIKSPFKYNFLFFLNRVLAPFHKLI